MSGDKARRLRKIEEVVARRAPGAETPCTLKPLSPEEAVEVLEIARDCGTLDKLVPATAGEFVERLLSGESEAAELLRRATT